MTDKTTLGDRMKEYEEASTSRRAFKGQPIIARLDGRAFHTFCRGLKRPYDERLSELMTDLTTELVSRFNPLVGYTQSDEITLCWFVDTDSRSEYPFSGRFQKIESLLAGFASAWFTREVVKRIPEKSDGVITFDCRSFVVPNLVEAYHCFLWRQQDATKNAISMAAQSMFSHKRLQNLNGSQLQELMWSEKGVNFNDYPAFFKRGVFVRRERVLEELSPEHLSRIPEAYRPTGPVAHTVIRQFDLWLSKQEDPVKALFGISGAPGRS